MRDLVARVVAREPDAVVPWTGRTMVVTDFATHVRSEYALHRRDLVGDDPLGHELLARPELTDHAVDVLGAILPRAGRTRAPDPDRDRHVRLRSGGTRDVALVVRDGHARLSRPDVDDAPVGLVLDPAARLLLLRGRCPMPPTRVRSDLPPADLERVQALLAGY